MRIGEVRTSVKFERQYRKLPHAIKEAAKEKEIIFRENSFNSRLDTHKLHWKEKDAWAFSVTRSHRIKFIFLKEGAVLFLEIGTHGIYQ